LVNQNFIRNFVRQTNNHMVNQTVTVVAVVDAQLINIVKGQSYQVERWDKYPKDWRIRSRNDTVLYPMNFFTNCPKDFWVK